MANTRTYRLADKLGYPMNDRVRWPPDQATIGVVGVAPLATALFYQEIIRATPAQKDWDHLRVFIRSDPKIPSRGRFFDLCEPDPSPFIRQAIAELEEWGADIAVVPCNTAHCLYANFSADSGIPVPSIIGVTVNEVAHDLPRGGRVAVLASRLTVSHRLYHERFEAVGIEVLDSTHVQSRVTSLIESVKLGDTSGSTVLKLSGLISDFARRGADAVVLGCTELGLVAPPQSPLPVIDSTRALAIHCASMATAGTGRLKP